MKRTYRYPAALTMLLLVLTLGLGGCALPPLDGRPQSHALPHSEAIETRLGLAFQAGVRANPGESGILTLADPLDAFAARTRLADAAEKTLDIQSYIWQYDITGRLMLWSIYKAADRGVRVRLLMDDHGIPGLDEPLAALDQHPNIHIRLFNPFVVRTPKWLGYITDFSRINRRMHNKSFTADNQATIVGGRNIADEYFGANPQALFADLDVLAVGPVVQDVSRDFDRYWASASSYPAEDILPASSEAELASVLDTLAATEHVPAARRYLRTVEESDFLQKLLDREISYVWAPVTMVSDDPAKGLGLHTNDQLLSEQLDRALGEPQHRVTLVSPYLIPTDSGMKVFRALVEEGIEVRALTNSLAANDIAIVHAGYVRYRRPLLEAGVQLYEMRPLSPELQPDKVDVGIMGSSASNLHAKTFAVDGETLFVGSLNFDPRSTHLNTEQGFVIESPKLAREMEAMFDEQVPLNAYELRLTDEGDVLWVERTEDGVVYHTHDPETGTLKRMMVFLFSLLPIEPLL